MIDISKIDLPSSPGVYKFINKDSDIIYVGKSKSLEKDKILLSETKQ